MFKSKIILSLFAILAFAQMNAQTDALAGGNDYTGFVLGLNLNYSTFQDLKYSAVQNSGLGIGLELGWKKMTEKQLWNAVLGLGIGTQSATTNSYSDAVSIPVGINFTWQKNIATFGKNQVYVGPAIDLDIFGRYDKELGNNSIYYLQNNTLSAAATLRRPVGARMELTWQLAVGLVSLAKESSGFAFSAPQDYLEEGGFDYLTGQSALYPFNRLQFETIGKLNRLQSDVKLHRGSWSLGYSWNFVNRNLIKNYSVISAGHDVSISHTF